MNAERAAGPADAEAEVIPLVFDTHLFRTDTAATGWVRAN